MSKLCCCSMAQFLAVLKAILVGAFKNTSTSQIWKGTRDESCKIISLRFKNYTFTNTKHSPSIRLYWHHARAWWMFSLLIVCGKLIKEKKTFQSRLKTLNIFTEIRLVLLYCYCFLISGFVTSMNTWYTDTETMIFKVNLF